MRKLLILIFLFIIIISICGQEAGSAESRYTTLPSDYPATDTLFLVHSGEVYELGVPCGYGKIGYANEHGIVVIEPQFACANPFQDGRARVSYECQLVKEGDYTAMHSAGWFYIDVTGKRIE